MADRRHVGVQAGPNLAIEPRVPVFGAEDDMNDDFAKGLGHGVIMIKKRALVNRARLV
jgi:hypothetical protein